MADRLLLALSSDQRLRARVVSGTALAAEAARRHDPTPLAAEAIARAALCAAVYPLQWKSYDRVSLQWSGTGPLQGLMAEARRGHLVRAYAKQPSAVLPETQDFGGRRGIGFALQPRGQLTVLRQEPQGTFDQGQVLLGSGEIDEDLENYLVQSEQIPTRIRALTTLDDQGRIVAALGVLVQALPSDEPAPMPSGHLIESLSPEASPEEALQVVLGEGYRVIEEATPQYRCTCSRERLAAAIKLIEVDVLLDMINDDQGAKSRCDFCGEHYVFDRSEVEGLLVDKVAEAKAARGEGADGSAPEAKS